MTNDTHEHCPCSLECEERRESAVNMLLRNRTCTGVEIKAELVQNGFGGYAIRKSLEFLASGGCSKISVFTCISSEGKGEKALQFGRKGRLFYQKSIEKRRLEKKILTLLSSLQKTTLEKFTRHHKSTYYFSQYELRKLLPYQGAFVGYCLDRLSKLGMIKPIQMAGSKFYTEPHNVARLTEQADTVLLEDRAEFVVVHNVHELIMNLYPLGLIEKFKGAIRPHTSEDLMLTGGMSFDIFYPLREKIGDKRFVAVDVYTRIPVNGFVVNSFLKKIDWASSRSRKGESHCLRGKTFGIIVFRNATPNAIKVANLHGIRFLRLSDIKIDYSEAKKEATSILS